MSYNIVRLKVTELPGYDHLLRMVRERPDSLLLDIGCGCECNEAFMSNSKGLTCRPVGHDTRKIVLDGFPARNIIASDISRGNYAPVLLLKETFQR